MATIPSSLAERRSQRERPAEARIVNPDPRYPKAKLIPPTTRGYIYLAGHVRSRFDTLPFVLPNARRAKLLARLKALARELERLDRKSTRLNSSHVEISYAVFCLKKKKEA